MPEAITSQHALDAFRRAEASQFRHAVNKQGELQKTGGTKARLAAWVLSSPGREGSFAGRRVKALVNLGSKGKFQALAASFQRNREASVNNMVGLMLREGESRLDADFSKRFSGEVGRRQEQGASFSAQDFAGLQDTMKALVDEQRQARRAVIDGVQRGQPTDRMKTLNKAELEFAAKVLSPARYDVRKLADQQDVARMWEFPEGVDGDKFNALEKEFNTMTRQLRKRLNDTLKPAGETYTVNSLLQEGRQATHGHLEEARAEVEKHLTQFRESYVGVLEGLARERAAPPSPPAQATPVAHAETPAAARAETTPPVQQPTPSRQERELSEALRMAQADADSAKRIYEDMKASVEGQKDAAGNLPPDTQRKVAFYRETAQQAQYRLRDARNELALLRQRVDA